MAKIYITGNRNPITVSRALAEQVAEFKKDSSILPNETFSSKDFVVEKRKIESVLINDIDDNQSEVKDRKREENDEHYAQISKQYDEMIRARCLMKAEIKAKDTRVMELVYQSFTGKFAEQPFKDEVAKRQLAYFTKNPRHPYASINISDIVTLEKKEEDSIAEVMPQFMLKKAYAIMSEALDTAKRIHAL